MMEEFKPTKCVSYVNGLSSDVAHRVFMEYGISGIELYGLTYTKVSYGHWRLTAQCRFVLENNIELYVSVITTDSMLIDDWGEDELYFAEGGHYESNEEVLATALAQILRVEANQEKIINLQSDEEDLPKCGKYPDSVAVPDEEGDCSLCGSPLDEFGECQYGM